MCIVQFHMHTHTHREHIRDIRVFIVCVSYVHVRNEKLSVFLRFIAMSKELYWKKVSKKNMWKLAWNPAKVCEKWRVECQLWHLHSFVRNLTTFDNEFRDFLRPFPIIIFSSNSKQDGRVQCVVFRYKHTHTYMDLYESDGHTIQCKQHAYAWHTILLRFSSYYYYKLFFLFIW